MVVLIDCSAHCTEGVVAVGHRVRDRELFKSARARGLDDAHISDVVGNHCIESDAHFLAGSAFDVMSTEDSVGDSVFAGLI